MCCICYADNVKKPTEIILPTDNWCIPRYFTQLFNKQDSTVRISDCHEFTEDIEFPHVISKVGRMLTTDMGYSLKDVEIEIKLFGVNQTEDNVLSSKSSGASISEIPLDILKRPGDSACGMRGSCLGESLPLIAEVAGLTVV